MCRSKRLALKQFELQRSGELLTLGRFGRVRAEIFEAPGAQLSRVIRTRNRVGSRARAISRKAFFARSAAFGAKFFVVCSRLFLGGFRCRVFSRQVWPTRFFFRVGHFRLLGFATRKRKEGQGNERRGKCAGQVVHERHSTGSFVRTQGAVFRRSFEQTFGLCHARPPCMCIS